MIAEETETTSELNKNKDSDQDFKVLPITASESFFLENSDCKLSLTSGLYGAKELVSIGLGVLEYLKNEKLGKKEQDKSKSFLGVG